MLWTHPAAQNPQSTRAFTREFPFAKPDEIAKRHGKSAKLTRYLAKSHDLTVDEVHEQLELLAMQTRLARDLVDVHDQDCAFIKPG